MVIEIKGKTNHGKNRVREHGNLWEVLKLPTGVVNANPMPVDKVVLKSVLTGDERWVSKTNDKNFEFVLDTNP